MLKLGKVIRKENEEVMKEEGALALVVQKIQLDEANSYKNNEELFKALSGYLEYLIQTDFNKLVSILYRIDVSEQKVKKALANNLSKIPAGQIIARLLIERSVSIVFSLSAGT